MVVLDTDHMSFMERANGAESTRLRTRMEQVSAQEKATTIVSFEEQARGWLGYLARDRPMAQQIEAYRRLHRQLDNYGAIQVLDFDETAANEFQRLKRSRLKVGPMDLKIAAIVLAHDATLLTRNLKDFNRVPGLKAEDWTA